MIFLFNGNYCILVQNSPGSILLGTIANKSALVQVMDWHWKGNRPLSGLMRTRFYANIWHNNELRFSKDTISGVHFEEKLGEIQRSLLLLSSELVYLLLLLTTIDVLFCEIHFEISENIVVRNRATMYQTNLLDQLWVLRWRDIYLDIHTVECHYNAVQFIMILHIALQWQQQKVNQTSNSQQTPHTLPSWVRNGMSFVKILEKIDHIITHCPVIHSQITLAKLLANMSSNLIQIMSMKLHV